MNIGIITQARMSSTRLPAKVLKKIAGKTLLEYHVQRAGQAGFPVIIATSTDHSDNAIDRLGRQKKWQVFRGDLANVLSRYYHAAKAYHLDTVIRITSDCPLIDASLIKQAVTLFETTRADYVSNTLRRTFPRGFDVEIFSFTALTEAYRHATTLEQREHVTPYIWQNTNNSFTIKQLVGSKNSSSYRITVDTQEDFELIKILIEQYHAHTLSYTQIIQLLDYHPQLVAINRHVEQKKDGQSQK